MKNTTRVRISIMLSLLFILSTCTFVSAATAPPLTELYVYAVESAKAPGWEYIPKPVSPFIVPETVKDHGGSYLRIVTKQMGYSGNNNFPEMNGSTNISQYRVDYITQLNVVVGFYRYWDCSNVPLKESGTFSLRAISTVGGTQKTCSVYVN